MEWLHDAFAFGLGRSDRKPMQAMRGGRSTLLAIALLILCGTLGCSSDADDNNDNNNNDTNNTDGAEDIRTNQDTVVAGRRRPSVVLLSIDTLRADHLSCYGYARATTPVIDAIAAESVRFEEVRAQATATLTSHLSLLTSLNPPQLGITRPDGRNDRQSTTQLRLAEGATTLAEVLQAQGYRTAAITNGGFVSKRFGFDRGFDHFEMIGSTGAKSPMRQILESLEKFLAKIGSDREEPLFLFLHTYEVHSPYDAPSPFEREFSVGTHADFVREKGFPPQPKSLNAQVDSLTEADVAWVRDLYDNGIRAMDDMMADLVMLLRDHDLYDSAHFIILSDHGEAFMDHGLFGHGPFVYEELVRVPLIWRQPGGRNGGRVCSDTVALVDVAPAIVELTGAPRPTTFEGGSLRCLLEAEDPEPSETRAIYSDAPNWSSGGIRSLHQGNFKLIRAGEARRELYDLSEDPAEHADLSETLPKLAAQLERQLDEWVRQMIEEARHRGTLALDEEAEHALSDEAREQLRALGYIE